MKNNSNEVLNPFNLAEPETPSRRVKLFSANEEELDLSEVGSGEQSPFAASGFDRVGDWLGKHGPAISHLFLIVGSAAGTFTNALHFSDTGSGIVPTLLVTLLFCGLIVEAAFAFSWLKRGSVELAGNQLKTAKDLYNLSSIIMIGDLSLSVAEIALGTGLIAGYWVGIVQPIGAVYLVRLFFRLKGEHPMVIARQRVATLKARMQAASVESEAQVLQLQLDEERHQRFMQRAALEQRISAGESLVSSGWFRRQIKRATRDAVGQKLLPETLGKLKNLPGLLRLPRNRAN